ncbi:MAG: hypothetical protein ACYTEK_23745 [Planctomycetota bacterium]|jgi:hypothetical protein
MPLHVRSIAVNIAVICFFVLSLVGWVSGLSPSVCCKRAMIGAVLAYIAGAWATRAINAVLIHAMITNQMNQETNSGLTSNRKIVYKDERRGD